MIVTSVTGHIQSKAFLSKYGNWTDNDPKVLITDAEIEIKVEDNKEKVAQNLESFLSSKSDHEITDIVLWLDCDREGEAICFEVLEVILGRSIQKEGFELADLEDEFGLKIHRAKFSAATKGDIVNAIQNLEVPDINQKEVIFLKKMFIDF